MRSTLIRTLIGLAIGVFFVWLSARDWPMSQLTGDVRFEDGHVLVGGASVPGTAPTAVVPMAQASMSTDSGVPGAKGWVMNLWWLLPYLAILTAVHFLRVIRWQPLLDPIIKLDFWFHNRIGAVGFMAMFLFPLRLGELVRPYLVKRARPDVRMTQVLATVVVERVVDGLMVSLVLFGVLNWLPAADPAVENKLRLGALGALLVFAGVTVVLAGAVWQRKRTVRLIEVTFGLVSKKLAHKLTDLLDTFLVGLRALPSPTSFAWFLFLTAVYWAINGIGVWCMVQAFYLPVDVVGSYAMMACVVVGMMIPNSPGNVGSFWYFLLMPAALYGIAAGSTQAIAFGITVWLLQLLQQTVFGAWFLLRGQVSLRRVIEATQQTEAALTDTSAAALPGS